MKNKDITFSIFYGYKLNTKNGFKIIYDNMKYSNCSFFNAIKKIFLIREINISSIKSIINDIEDEQMKEMHDYVHAIFNNNINN